MAVHPCSGSLPRWYHNMNSRPLRISSRALSAIMEVASLCCSHRFPRSRCPLCLSEENYSLIVSCCLLLMKKRWINWGELAIAGWTKNHREYLIIKNAFSLGFIQFREMPTGWWSNKWQRGVNWDVVGNIFSSPKQSGQTFLKVTTIENYAATD